MDIKSVGTRATVASIQKALNDAKQKVRYLEGELYNVRKNCPHENYSSSESWQEINIDNDEWQERLNTCNDCGYAWHQQTDRWGDFEGSGLD